MQYRHCSAGNHEVLETEFYKRGKSFQPNCKSCQQQINRDRYLANKDGHLSRTRGRIKHKTKLLQHWKQQLGCAVCGESHGSCLDFHHIHPGTKDLTLGTAFSRVGVEQVLGELGKCVVLCKNCHAKEHDGVLNHALVPLDAADIDRLRQLLDERNGSQTLR